MGFDDTPVLAMVLAELLEPLGAMVEDLKAARHHPVACRRFHRGRWIEEIQKM